MNPTRRLAALSVLLLFVTACGSSETAAPGSAPPGGGTERRGGMRERVEFPPDSPIVEQARIEGESLAKFPEGSWIKFTDNDGKEHTVTLAKKMQGRDGWEAATTIDGGQTINEKFGSVSRLARGSNSPQSMAEETVEVNGRSLACKVFTLANGQKKWLSAEVPVGGIVKLVGPNGEKFITLTSYGEK